MAGASEAGDVVKAKFSFSKKDNKRQNDYCLGGEIWKNVPNTDFAYYSTMVDFRLQKTLVSLEMDAFYVLKMSLKEVNEWADPDNSGKDFFTLWMAQAKESEEE